MLAAAPHEQDALLELAQAGHGVPLYVADRRGDLFAWNREACEWFADFGELPEGRRNMVQGMLSAPAARAVR